MIKCRLCNEDKDDTEFNFRDRVKGLRQYYCRDCSRQQGKSHYNRNRQRVITRSVKNRVRGNYWYAQFKDTLECECCGEKESCCLEFHHLDPQQKENQPSNIFNWESFKREISKCVVVCSNCHKKIHRGIINTSLISPSSLMEKALVFETSRWKFDSSLGRYDTKVKN